MQKQGEKPGRCFQHNRTKQKNEHQMSSMMVQKLPALLQFSTELQWKGQKIISQLLCIYKKKSIILKQ